MSVVLPAPGGATTQTSGTSRARSINRNKRARAKTRCTRGRMILGDSKVRFDLVNQSGHG